MSLKAFIIACLMGVAVASHLDHHYSHENYHHEEHHAPQPYKFGYEIKDHEGKQYRHEVGDGHGTVKGSYGYVDHKGIHREVHYIADKHGFRAQVKTNEPGTANQDPASVKIHSTATKEHHIVEPHHIETHHIEPQHHELLHHKIHHHLG